MRIITITGDWFKNDYYLPSLKGEILSVAPQSVIVDITNDISPMDVLQAMFVLRHSFRHFPEGTIHLIGVASESTEQNPMAIVPCDGHFFVGLNDGRFVHLFDKLPPAAYALPQPKKFSSFMALEQFVSAIKIIETESYVRDTVRCDVKSEVVLRPVCTGNSIIGKVLYIDSFGNAITNITRELFAQMRAGRDFEILLQGPYSKIATVSRGYSSVPQGETVAFFNSLDHLEVAMNNGNIARAEDLAPSSEITIRFF